MKTKEINGSLFLINENAEIKENSWFTRDGYLQKATYAYKNHKDDKLVIAQQFIEGKTDYIVNTLFEIELTPTDEEDVEKLAKQYAILKNGDGLDNDIAINREISEEDFKAGYNAKQGISKEKYENDLDKAITFGYKWGMKVEADAHRDNNLFKDENFNKKEFLQSLNYQPEREVEVVMEDKFTHCEANGFGFSHYKEQPKINPKLINGKEYKCFTIKYK